MDDRTLAGLIGVLAVGCLVVIGLYGLANGYLLGSPGDVFAPSLGTFALTLAVIVALTVLGARAGGWLETPYW